MKRILISAAMLFWAACLLPAQNLDPTVVVTNTYAQEATGIEKPSQLRALPDSVFRFNLDFDYAVQSTPYRGAYEFNPYLVELRPTARLTEDGRFYLNLGAGYTLHPELTLVWTPVQRDRFHLNLYADHRSYWGSNLSRMRSVAGLNGLLTWNGGQFLADVRYRNVMGSDSQVQQAMFHAVDFRAGVKSDPEAALIYQLEASGTGFWSPFVDEFHLLAKGGIGTHFGINYLHLGVSAELLSQAAGYVGNLAFTPRYLLTPGDFRIDLGAKLSFLYRSTTAFYPQPFVFPLFPDVHVTYYVLPDVMALQASATGGHVMNVYSGLVDENPFLAAFTRPDGTPLALDCSVERWNIMLGARGNIAERFHYDLQLGYAFRTNAQLWGMTATGAPALGYAPKYHMFYTDLTMGWKSDFLDVDARLLYRLTSLKEDYLFAPAAFCGNASAVYNWGDRIRAGVTVEGQTARVAQKGAVPGYVDLGLLGDLQMTRSLGFWLRLGNLLNQPVQRVPFRPENGIYVTVGARLNF